MNTNLSEIDWSETLGCSSSSILLVKPLHTYFIGCGFRDLCYVPWILSTNRGKEIDWSKSLSGRCSPNKKTWVGRSWVRIPVPAKEFFLLKSSLKGTRTIILLGNLYIKHVRYLWCKICLLCVCVAYVPIKAFLISIGNLIFCWRPRTQEQLKCNFFFLWKVFTSIAAILIKSHILKPKRLSLVLFRQFRRHLKLQNKQKTSLSVVF